MGGRQSAALVWAGGAGHCGARHGSQRQALCRIRQASSPPTMSTPETCPFEFGARSANAARTRARLSPFCDLPLPVSAPAAPLHPQRPPQPARASCLPTAIPTLHATAPGASSQSPCRACRGDRRLRATAREPAFPRACTCASVLVPSLPCSFTAELALACSTAS